MCLCPSLSDDIHVYKLGLRRSIYKVLGGLCATVMLHENSLNILEFFCTIYLLCAVKKNLKGNLKHFLKVCTYRKYVQMVQFSFRDKSRLKNT